MADFTSPPDDGDESGMIVTYPYNLLLSPDEVTGVSTDENVLYLLASGRVVASKLPIEGARLLALGPVPVPASTSPVWNDEAVAGGITLSNGLRTASKTVSGNDWASVRAKQARSTEFGGRYYFEIRCVTGAGAIDAMYGFSRGTLPLNDVFVGGGSAGESYSIYQRNGNRYTAGVASALTSGWGASTDIVLGFALNLTTRNAWVSINDVFIGDPVADTGAVFTDLLGAYYPMASFYNGDGVYAATLMSTAESFLGTIPSGYLPYSQ